MSLLILLLCAWIIFFISCKKEYSCEGCINGNKPPIADAGPDQLITLPADSVSLDGAASSDPDGKISEWLWTKISGPAFFNINDGTATKTDVKGLVAGTYLFELKVTDNGGLSAKDTMMVTVDSVLTLNHPPVANAGQDQTITVPTSTVTLDGSGSIDPDNNIAGYFWTKISGPTSFSITNANSVQTQVVNLVLGTYQFELKVIDVEGLFSKDTMTVTVDSATGNHPPVANAGQDQTITLPTNTTTLDGSGSTDPDNNITSYLWTKISGPSSFNIVNANVMQTQVASLVQGVYQFELKVTDAGGLFSKDSILVTVVDQPCEQLQSIMASCDNTARPVVCAQLVPVGNLSLTREALSVAAAGNKILFAGGYQDVTRVDIYDVSNNSWTTAELSEGRYDIASVTAGNKIFFGGGESSDGTWPTATVDIYDVSTNTWSVSFLSSPGNSIAAATVGNKIFFAGGDGGFAGPIRTGKVDIYDLLTSTWSTATLSEGRDWISAVAVNDKVYFAGGEILLPGGWAISNKVDIYDNANNTWSTSLMQEGKIGFAAIAAGNKIYWAGGKTGMFSQGISASCLVEVRDVNTGVSSIEHLFKSRSWTNTGSQNAVVKDNKIIFFTGHNDSQEALVDANKFDIYDMTANTWSIGVLPVNIIDAVIISVNNTIYVAGGYVNGGLSKQVWKLEF